MAKSKVGETLGTFKKPQKIKPGMATAPSMSDKIVASKAAAKAEKGKHKEVVRKANAAEAKAKAAKDKPVKKGKGGYDVYKKDSASAKSFRAAFNAARAAKGADATFMWRGRRYTTKKKGE